MNRGTPVLFHGTIASGRLGARQFRKMRLKYWIWGNYYFKITAFCFLNGTDSQSVPFFFKTPLFSGELPLCSVENSTQICSLIGDLCP